MLPIHDRHRTRIAHHEAGHAVAAFFLDQKTKLVTVVPDEARGVLGQHQDWGHQALLANLQGTVSDVQTDRIFGEQPNRDPRERSRAWVQYEVEKTIQVLLAGAIATRRFDRRGGQDVGAQSDLNWAVALAGALADRFEEASSPRQTRMFLNWLHVRTEDLLKARWSCVKAVAAALLERNTLTGRQLTTVVLETMVRQPAARAVAPPGTGERR